MEMAEELRNPQGVRWTCLTMLKVASFTVQFGGFYLWITLFAHIIDLGLWEPVDPEDCHEMLFTVAWWLIMLPFFMVCCICGCTCCCVAAAAVRLR